MDVNNLWKELGICSQFYDLDCLEENTILAARYLTGPRISRDGTCITYEGYDLEKEERILIQEYFPERCAFRNAGSSFVGCGFQSGEWFRRGLDVFVQDADFMRRFSDIPGIMSVKTCFRENGTAYVIRERCEGESFHAFIRAKGGKLAETEVLALLKPIIEALEEIHKSGIYHGELSKNSIVILKDGHAKLLGIDQKRKFGQCEAPGESVVLLTNESAPEQYANSKQTGPWTDVYGICMVFYHALCGKYVPNASERMMGADLIAFEEFGLKVSSRTERAIIKGLALNINERIQSMTELRESLYGEEKTGIETDKKEKKRGRGLWTSIISGRNMI